jgi:hypothetical protein
MGLAPVPGMRKSLLLFLMFGATACGGLNPLDVLGQSSDPDTYRLTDSGVRCVTTPCPSLLATSVGTGKSVLVSEIQFPSTMSEGERHGVINRAATSGGLVVRGSIHGEEPNGVFELDAIIE